MSLPFARAGLVALAIAALAGPARAETSSDAPFVAIAGEDLVAEADAAAEATPAAGAPVEAATQEPTPTARKRTRPVGPEQMIDEMITTARKRNEVVQNTPVAVTSFGLEQIANRDLRRASDLDGLAPNVEVDNSFGAAQAGRLTIRGVGQIETTTSFDPAVGIYLDGVYVPRSQGQIGSIFDIERVEVLRGPQGTLYGKNTIGGAINITTRKPEFDFGANATARFGNYGRMDTRWMVNLPLVAEKAALRVALASNYDKGYEKNTFRGDPSRGSPPQKAERLSTDRLLGSRAELLLLPSSNVEVMLSGEYSREDRRPQASRCIVTSGFANVGVTFAEGGLDGDLYADGFQTCAAAGARDKQKFSSDIPSNDDFRVLQLANTINWEIGDSMMLKSITGFRNQHYDVQQDLDGTELGFAQSEPGRGIIKSNSISQELQLSGRMGADKLYYTAGLFVFSEKVDDDTPGGASLLGPELQKRAALAQVDPGNPNSQTVIVLPVIEETRDVDNKSYAAYGSLTYAITSKLSATAGVRRTLERRRLKKTDVVEKGGFNPITFLNVNPGDTLTAVGSVPFDRSARFSNWSPNASLSYSWTPRILTYVSYSTGFRSGGFNGRNNFINPDINEIDPEDLTTYEVGAKTSFFDSRLVINVAQFYSIYEDIQRPIFGPGPAGLLAISFQNAAEARLHGTEIEFAALPLPGLRLESSIGTFSGRYTEFDDPLASVPVVPQFDLITGRQIPNLPRRNLADARLPGQPNYLMSFAVGYQLPVPVGLLSSRVQWTHRGVQANDSRDTAAIRSPKYGLLDARLSLMLNDGKTELTLFGSNLLDREYIQNGIDATDTAGRGIVFDGPPRRYGIELKRDF